MSSLSVQGRITLIAGCCLLASAAALVASSLFNAARMQEQVLTSTTLEGQHAAENWMKAMGSTQAARVTSYLDEAYFRATLLAEGILFQRKNAADNFVHSEALRNAVNQQLQDAAESSANLLGVYAVFEPNQLDGEDDNYQGSTALGANDKGRFSSYWARVDGKVTLEVMDEALLANDKPSVVQLQHPQQGALSARTLCGRGGDPAGVDDLGNRAAAGPGLPAWHGGGRHLPGDPAEPGGRDGPDPLQGAGQGASAQQ